MITILVKICKMTIQQNFHSKKENQTPCWFIITSKVFGQNMIKCVECGKYIDPEEVVWVMIDDSHEAAYCVVCSPDDNNYEDNQDY